MKKKIIPSLILFFSFSQVGPAKRHSLEHNPVIPQQKQEITPYHPRAQKPEETTNTHLLKVKEEKKADDKKNAARTIAKHLAIGTATAVLTTAAGALTVAGSAELASEIPDSSPTGSDITPSEMEISLDDISSFVPAMPSLPQTDDGGDDDGE